MKAKKMQPQMMWAVLDENGVVDYMTLVRSEARQLARSRDYRVVRVRVTEAP